ncbi:MAG TPA: lysylphosphatidylglycerol synthase transmembrane domain-containing protein [Solirubrobacteraceae bacterium]|nr:lysylphosphatidylglycerol synthase transmembrane domain-containing protein [Solirubrobacteraceae bacterium]
MGASTDSMPKELSPHRLRRRLLQFACVVIVVVLVVLLGPGLGSLRRHLADASPGWVAAGVGFELLSALSYVVVFRTVFCRLMSWRLSYQIGMAEQGANSVLSVSGAGGLALGAWALRRGGMSTEHIARRTVAFFILTSLANVGGVIVFAALYGVGLLQHDRNPALTYTFGGLAAIATALVLSLPSLLKATPPERDASSGRLAVAVRWVRYSLGQGIRDGVALLRQRPIGVLIGSVGFMAFDIAVLGVCFRAFGAAPAVGTLALGYLIGQLGGNIPVPGGIGGVDAGLVGTFALYHQPLAATTAAVLVYHGIALWLPAVLGSVAFVQLRRTLRREHQPAAMCAPLAEPIEAVHNPAAA